MTSSTEIGQDQADETKAPAGENVQFARELARSPQRRAAATDDRLENESSRAELNVHIPGAAAISSVRRITPFLFFLQVYADVMYPHTSDPGARVARFKVKNPKLFWLHWFLDMLIQIMLVAVLLGGSALIVFNGLKATFGAP